MGYDATNLFEINPHFGTKQDAWQISVRFGQKIPRFKKNRWTTGSFGCSTWTCFDLGFGKVGGWEKDETAHSELRIRTRYQKKRIQYEGLAKVTMKYANNC